MGCQPLDTCMLFIVLDVLYNSGFVCQFKSECAHMHERERKRPVLDIVQKKVHKSTMCYQEKQSRSSYLWHVQ